MKNFVISLRKTTSSKGKDRAEPSDGGQESLASTRRREAASKGLDVTIQIINDVNNLVPIDMAKNILTGISSILVLLQASLNNKEDLKALLRSCEDICSTLALATKGVSVDRMSEALGNALDALRSSIDDLKLRVEGALRRGHARRFFGASLDVKEISGWTTELDRIFTSFSARLNIVSVIRLEQIYELLQQPNIQNLIPDPPPPPPAMFFGREELLRDIKGALLRDEDVSLIGPGGIGKSTLAMALINEENITQHYRRRFFVTYTGMDPKTITFGSFVDRIANVLGLPMSGAEGERQIKTNLGSSPVLLVLDNAETFEDAGDLDEVTRISDFIAHVANTRGATVVLTSRTSSNARRVSWTQFDVPPLAREPARESFKKIYHGEISDDEIDGLLATVDFHPLSISILAYTAKENRWSAKVLLERWNLHRSELLQTGNGKDSLGFTIRLSLDSPSVKALGDDAVHVLWIVAFLPQGLNQDHLDRLFPSLPRISTIVDTLCKVSLVYPTGSFLMVLAPIRLFLLDAFRTAGHQLLEDVRHVYYSSLRAVNEKRDSHSDLLVSNHLNIEHLITFDITHTSSDIGAASFACYVFLRGLVWHKPRPTSLSPLVSLLPEDPSIKKGLKAYCLFELGRLYSELSNYSSAGVTFLASKTLFIPVGNHAMASICTENAAMTYNNLGYISRARQLLDDFICSPSWQDTAPDQKAGISFVLDWSRVQMSSESIDSLFVHSMDDNARGLSSHISHRQARMWHGYNSPEEVQRHLEPLRSNCMSSSDVWDRWRFLCAVAEAAFLQYRLDAAMQLLNEAHESVNGSFQLTVEILSHKAAVASVQGDYDLARSLLQRGLDTLGLLATPSSTQFLRILCLRGQNELYAGHYSAARQFLVDAVVDCDTQGDILNKTSCIRALGEVEMLLDRKLDSDKSFAQVVELCRESGVPPALLDVCMPMMRVDNNKFPGWQSFLQTHTG